MFFRLAVSVVLAAWASPAAAAKPALAVVVVVDQLSAEHLEESLPRLKGGIARLAAESVWYRDARFSGAPTVTACGHAALASGAFGSINGIAGNNWFDRASGRIVYSVEDPGHRVLGRPAELRDGTSPKNLKVPALADALRAADPKSKVVAISVKDRSAILLGGHRPTAAVWFDRRTARFTTSDYYASAAPAWVRGENERVAALQKDGYGWERTAASAGIKDDYPFEGSTRGAGHSFPHRVAPSADGWAFATALGLTPEVDLGVLRLAKAAVEAEALGADESPDLLFVSLSAHDFVLHAYGPDSAEAIEDLVLLDAALGQLLTWLEQRVGKGKLVVALASDHGGGAAVEISKERGLPAGRLSKESLVKAADAALSARFGAGKWALAVTEAGLYLARRGGTDLALAEQVAAEALRPIEGVAGAWPASRPEALLGTPGGRALLRGYDQSRGGDVLFAMLPGWIWEGDIAAHGTPYLYDSQVPVMLRIPGKKPASVWRKVDPIDLVGTLAAVLGIPAPGAWEGEHLVEAL